MRKTDWLFALVLVVLAVLIWVRDMSWTTSVDDTLPVLVAIPLFLWMEWPWKLTDRAYLLKSKWVLVGVISTLLGSVTNLTLGFTIGWACLAWSWIDQRVADTTRRRLARLMILPVMAFPWVTLDLQVVGWWFRLSGAWAATQLFSLIGLSAEQDGTHLLVNGLPISVDVSCAGLNTLQSLLIAGSLLAYLMLGSSRRYWANVALLVPMSWIANTSRIVALCVAALVKGPEFAMGTFHDLGGLFVLMVMFGICWLGFSWQSSGEAVYE